MEPLSHDTQMRALSGRQPFGPEWHRSRDFAVAAILATQWGSVDAFKTEFNAKTAAVQGSGWGWLGYDKAAKKLAIATCANQDPLSTTGLVPLLGIDVWEHAYYLQYKNVRPEYLKQVWGVVNWKDVASRYAAAVK